MAVFMARTIPKSINDRLDFFRTHADVWAADPGAIGLTPSEIAALEAAYNSAKAAHAMAQLARLAAESATIDQNSKMAALVEMGGGLISRIKAIAAGNTVVYTAARLQVPAKPTLTGIAPPTPGDFRCTPRYDGAVVLSWKSDLKRTSFYRIERRLLAGGRTMKAMLDVVRDNTFTDETLPIGFTSVEYILTPIHQRRGGAANSGSARSTMYTPGNVRVGAGGSVTHALAA